MKPFTLESKKSQKHCPLISIKFNVLRIKEQHLQSDSKVISPTVLAYLNHIRGWGSVRLIYSEIQLEKPNI